MVPTSVIESPQGIKKSIDYTKDSTEDNNKKEDIELVFQQ